MCNRESTQVIDVVNFLKKKVPQIRPVFSLAAYLLWLDCRAMQGCAAEFAQYMKEHTVLYLSGGRQYGENGYFLVGINIACPRSRLEDGMRRLAKGARDYEEWVVARC